MAHTWLLPLISLNGGYFDTHTDDGYTAVFVLKNRDYGKLHLPPGPQITLQVKAPDGTNRVIVKDFPGFELAAARDHCDVSIGDKLWGRGRNGTYHIHPEEEDVMLDLEFIGTVPGWPLNPSKPGNPPAPDPHAL